MSAGEKSHTPAQVPSIAAARLDLVSMSPQFLRAALAGSADAANLLGAPLPDAWPDGTAARFQRRLEQLRADPAAQPWLLRAMVLREPVRRVVGYINFHAPPDARGAVEVGYNVLEGERRRGYAEESVRALFGWAQREHGVTLFIASIAPGNAPSLALARKLGFVQTGVQIDEEDGEELVFELSLRDGWPDA